MKFRLASYKIGWIYIFNRNQRKNSSFRQSFKKQSISKNKICTDKVILLAR